MIRVLVIDDGRSLLMDAIERVLQHETRAFDVPMTIRMVDRDRETFFGLPDFIPLPPDPKVGQNLRVGRYGQMPIPTGKRKKFKPSRQQRRK